MDKFCNPAFLLAQAKVRASAVVPFGSGNEVVWLGRQSPEHMWEKDEFKTVFLEIIVADMSIACGLIWIYLDLVE